MRGKEKIMDKNNPRGWLYLLPAFLFLGIFLVYPLVDVFIYSFEENFNFASQSYTGIGFYNFSYVLRDPYFLQALKNTFILVLITVPVFVIRSMSSSSETAAIAATEPVFSLTE